MLTVVIDGKEVQVSPDSVKAPEGWAIITPDSDPSEHGLVRKSGMEAIVKERVHQAKQSALKDAVNDEGVTQAVLSKHGITLKDGKPVGLEGANIDELRKGLHSEIKSTLEKEYAPIRKENNRMRQAVVERELKAAAATSGVRKGLVDIVAGNFKDRFGIDSEGNVYERDGDGFKLDGNGVNVTPSAYFGGLRKSADFADLFDDSRQPGGYGGNGNPPRNPANTTKADLKSRADKSRFIAEHGLDAFNALK